MTIRTKTVPVEAHNLVGIVERYHRPLRRAYEIITSKLRTDTCTKEVRLQMAIKAINDTLLVTIVSSLLSLFLVHTLESPP